jgi:uncharacterized protein YuzE
MKFIYDQEADALSILLTEGRAVVRTEELDAGTLVDLDRHGNPVAIEILRPARKWPIAEIVERYKVNADTRAILASLWREHQRYPFERPAEKGAALSAEVVVS